jgi:prephenate dehydrogenase
MRSAPRALIAGLGLIGGSIGMALRARGWQVAFLDPHVSAEEARRAGAADERVEAIHAAEITILATPLNAALQLLRDAPRNALVTSVASVMQPLRAMADQRKLNFVAGHPLAGSQERGLGAARGDLFLDTVWFADRDDPLLQGLVRDCSARLEIISAAEHDAAIALTSHLPQVLSTALAAYLESQGIDERFSGSGLRTFLRLAGSDASVWLPVIEANRANITPHADALAELVRAILAGDETAFERAQRLWARLLSSAPR